MQKIVSGILLVLYSLGIFLSFFLYVNPVDASYVNNIGIQGDFEINNDDVSTTSQTVTLNMSITGAERMRFGNTIAERDSAVWEIYSNTRSWTLMDIGNATTVYAEFENASGGTLFVQDDIVFIDLHPVLPYDTGLTLWLDAADTPTIVNSSGSISQWNDKSGNNYHAIQTTGTRQANLLTNEIDFNGTSDFFYVDNLNYVNTNPLDGLFVCTVFRTQNTSTSISGNWAFLDFDRSEWFDFYNYTADVGFSYDSNGTIRDLRTTGFPVNDNKLHVSCASYDNTQTTDTTISIDGNIAYSGDVEPIGAQIGVGQARRYGFVGEGSEATTENGNRNNIYYDGGINEILYFDTAVSKSDQQDIECYLGQKWGINIGKCPLDQDPIASVKYNPESVTISDVTTTLISESEGITITNNGGSDSYVFTENGSFTFEFVDATSNTGSITATVDWINTVPTDITLSNNILDENIAANTIVGTFSSTDDDTGDAHTYDLVAGAGDTDNATFTLSGAILSINASPDFETQSSYSIRVQTDDQNGGVFEKIFTITINDLDEVPPVILLTGSGIINIAKNISYNDDGAVCSDNVDVNCSVVVGGATVNTAVLGSYVISYDASDAAGNIATQVTRTVNVIAGDAPIITLSGSVSEVVEVNTTYTDAGATASDSEDGDITSNIVTVNSVNTSATGSYSVTYDVTDSSDNNAIQVTRTVNVLDTTPPVLTLAGTGVVNVIKNTNYSDAGAAANDIFEGDITTDIVTVNPVDTSTLGTYTITYNVSDSSGNAASQVTRIVNVITGDIPTITLNGSSVVNHEVNTTYSDDSATVLDSEDGDITDSIIIVNPVDTTATGSYIVTYNANDSSDNSATQVTRVVNVVDTTAPITELIGSGSISLIQGSSFSDLGASCSDNLDITCSTIVGGDTVDTSRIGTYIVTYDAVDVSGNSAMTITRVINVTAAPILINEVEYDTPGVESASEWFELYNPTSGVVNIENWTITEKVGSSSNKSYTFGDVDIPAGGYIVITNEITDFQNIYPSITPDVDLPGVSFFALKNSPDDELELQDPSGVSIDYVTWENTSAGWDLEAIDFPICRLLVPDTDSSVDWSDTCISTPGAINSFNALPTDITLSSEDIDENNAAGATVTSLTTADTDSGDTHTYSLTVGAGDTDNASFSISGNSLQIASVADYETQQSYDIRIATNDGKGGIYEENFTISVNDINLAPTDISLNSMDIDENNSIGSIIGTFSAVDDGEDTNTLTYALACDIPGVDDSSFSISGNSLHAAAVYDFEIKDSYSVCIQVSDGVLSYDENFTININDLDEVAPVVVITPNIKLQNTAITDTTIQITDDIAINAVDVSVGTGSSASTSALSCTQTSSTQVDCTISVDSSGDLVIQALDTSSNAATDTEVNYIIDTVAPNIPSVSVETEAPFSIDSPELTFSSLDNIGIAHYTVSYTADDGGLGTGTLTTINPASSPIILSLDPDEELHVITVTVFDTAGNSSSNIIKFPPTITINTPTTLSNTTITDSTVTISTPTGNDITNITLTANTTGANLGTCTGAGGDTSNPYTSPVTCVINNITTSGTISITAEDSVISAQGINSQSYIVDITDPVITIHAPTKLDNASITDTTIIISDETAIDISDISIAGTSTVTSSSFSCSQTSLIRVDCSIQIDDSGDLIVSANDLAGSVVNETEPNYIIDRISPVISLINPSPENIEYLSPYTDGGAEFSDNIDGTGSLLGSGSVNTGILGSYTLDYNYTDLAGNTGATVTRTVHVVDTTPPVISLIGTGVTIEVGSIYIDAGATAVDNYDGNISSSIVSSGVVDGSTLGTYSINYNVTDSNGNIATQVTRNVEVVDTTPPIITLTGSDEIILEVGSAYGELGATVTDNLDAISPGSISIDSSSVDVNTVGTYSVTYDVADVNGNNATQVIRTVTVQDTTIPVITLTGTGETIEVGSVYNDAGATAIDNLDGNISANIITLNPVDTSTVGTYSVTYDVVDSSGNNATQVIRTVTVQDTTIPVITLTGTGETIEVGSVYNDAGATAIDNLDGNISANIITLNSVDTNTVGTYSVTYDVADVNGNNALQKIRIIEVVDTTAPVISLIGSSPLTIYKNAAYTEFGAICSDNFDSSCNVNTAGDVVDTTTLGTYIVSYNTTDLNGNSASQVTRIVHVESGNTPVLNLTGSGSITVEVNSSYVDAGAVASDSEDGNISANIVTLNPVDITSTGSYIISYDVRDSSDNIATQLTRTVNVVDTTAPTILLTGSGTINIFKNATYTEFGAICSDNFDSSCNVGIAGDVVDTTTLGTYTVSYNAIDTSGNSSPQITRTVEIVAGDIPVITLVGSGTIYHEVHTSYNDSGATVLDSEDGNITANIITVNPVDTTELGSYTITYDIIDFSGNNAFQVTRTVNVVDTTAPTIHLIGNAIETVYFGDTYIEAGANCSDNFDLNCNVSIAGDIVDENTLGTYDITYDASDGQGNISSQIIRTVEVVTGDIPIITLVGSGAIDHEVNTTYIDAGVIASDSEDGNITPNVSIINPVDVNTIGAYVIAYDVTDSNGNDAVNVTRIVNIVDTTAPTISLVGEGIITQEINTLYTDSGATASDNLDGDITGDITTINPVDTSLTGSYIITYDVGDTSGNNATQVTRIVNIITSLFDGDGDKVPDLIEIEQGTDPNNIAEFKDTDGNGDPDFTDPDNDGDGSVDLIETSAPNGGDYNNDGLTDIDQKNVATIVSDVDSRYVSLDTTSGSCSSNRFDMRGESTLSTQDSGFEYPLGLARFELECATFGETADIKVYYDRVYDTSTWVYRKYNETTQVYTDISSIVSYSTENIGGTDVTVVNYSIVDGGIYDEDGVENGIIIDPSGPSTPVIIPTGGGVSPQVCRDPQANNYERFGRADNSLCIYDVSFEEELQEELLEIEIPLIEESKENNELEELDEDEEVINTPVDTLIKDKDYIVENDFNSCSIIGDIQDVDYIYSGGKYIDTALSKYESEINKFSQIGIINGYPDGSFAPDKEMTRTEFLKIALKSHCYEYQNENPSNLEFIDVDIASWQAKVITKAQSLGMINGDIDEQGSPVFRPNDIISKAEAVKILMKLSLIDVHAPTELSYSDISVPWHEKYVITGETLGLFDSQRDKGIFSPDSGVERQEMIYLIDNLVQLYK